MLKEFKRIIIGAPIATQHEEHQKLNVPIGLTVFAADALSSTAYATDEILIALAASTVAIQTGFISLQVALAIAALIVLVVISYRQIIVAYPEGGGAYIVAKDNLGRFPSHLAAAALLIDYILTVAVSISAGVAAITSTGLFPQDATTFYCILFTVGIMVVNLRGLKESGLTFALPAYTFILSMISMLLVGFWQLYTGPKIAAQAIVHSSGAVGWGDMAFILLFLNAFSHGCAGLTGIEAVSNGVKAFKTPSAKRANTTMMIMGLLLGGIFLGITFLAFGFHIVPKPDETILSQVAGVIFGKGTFLYLLVQFSTMILLILAANTAFADFPRVTSFLARDGFLPRQLMNLGDRLVYNNGIWVLGLIAILLIWLYNGDTHSLIPLYAVGVFLCFTLSQSGMVMYHLRKKHKGWLSGTVINGLGGLVTAGVTIILAIEKFKEGAWIVILAIPIIVFVFNLIHQHYSSLGKQLVLDDNYTCPVPKKHKVLVLISGLGKNTVPALQYAKTLTADVEAIHVELNPESTELLKANWEKWGCDIPLKLLPSPFRTINEPVLKYIDDLHNNPEESWITVIVPEFVTKRFWHNILHNQTALLLKTLLHFRKGIIVTTVRFHLEE